MKIIVGAKDIVNKAYSAYLNLLPQEAPLEFAKNRLARLKLATRTLEFWLTFGAYAIPLAFLLYVLYWNFLPFGYDKTFTINVGSAGDTDSSQEFYLQPSRDLSDRMTNVSGTPYRTLNGIAYAVFQPKAVLKNAKITVSVESDPKNNVQVIPPHIDFDPNSVKWDYSWDFSTSTPKDLTGNAFHFDDCEYFDGNSKLELPNSADMFESGPFTVYAEWKPEDPNDDFQEIVGHYNWELLQEKNDVRFQTGRMNDAQGPFYSIVYPVDGTFFGRRHTALARYIPREGTTSGHLELYVDGKLAGVASIGEDVLWREYGNYPLSFGKSMHGIARYFTGSVCNVKIFDGQLNVTGEDNFTLNTLEQPRTQIYIEGISSTTVKSVGLHVEL